MMLWKSRAPLGTAEVISPEDLVTMETPGEKCPVPVGKADDIQPLENTTSTPSDVEKDGHTVNVDEQALDEDSPYESVRAAVRNTDGGDPANTIRAWILGMIFVTVASAINMFLSLRSPAISISAVVIQL